MPAAGTRHDTIEAYAALFDAEAARYDAAYDAPTPGGHVLRARLAAVIDELPEATGSVLDAGMGPGRLCEELARRGWTVSGVDASGAMVARARARLPEAQERLVQGELERLPFADGSFDAAVATGVLEYAQDRPAALMELARVLRPGGTAVVTMPNAAAPYSTWRRYVLYPAARLLKACWPGRRPAPGRRSRPPGRRRFIHMLEQAGLELESVTYTAYVLLPTPLDALFPRLTVRLGARLEGSGPRTGRLFATQLVCSARRP
jgi:ubiquinone/menaquinone biosynthesis C-methylase UbiE